MGRKKKKKKARISLLTMPDSGDFAARLRLLNSAFCSGLQARSPLGDPGGGGGRGAAAGRLPLGLRAAVVRSGVWW